MAFQFEHPYKIDVMKKLDSAIRLGAIMFEGDNESNVLKLQFFRDYIPFDMTGHSVVGLVIRADGGTVYLNEGVTVEDNRVSIPLPQSCFAVIGQITISVRTIKDGVKTVVFHATGTVMRSSTDTIIDPGHVVPSVDDVIAKLDEMDAKIAETDEAIEDAEEATANANNAVHYVAQTETSPAASAHAVGEYLIYNGALYSVIAAIAAGDALATGTNIAAVPDGVAGEVADVKSAFNGLTDRTGLDVQPNVTFTDGKGVKYNNGQLGTTEYRSYSNYIPVNGYEKSVVTMGKYTSATIFGIAFYTAATDSSYISGVRETYNSSSVGVEERTFEIPSTANYMKLAWFPSSSEFYSQFSCHLVKKGSLDDKLNTLVNVVTENVLNPNEITVGKYINKSGTMGSSDRYCVTGYIAVKKNDQVVLTYSNKTDGKTMRYVTAYNANKSAVSDSGAENVTSYTVPNGIAFVRVSADIEFLGSPFPRISLNGVAIKYQTYYGGLTSGLAKADHTNLDLFRFYPFSALPEYFVNNLAYKPLGSLSKGYICLVSDDGNPGLATYTVPMLIAKNVPGTFAVMRESGCWEDNTNKATILDAVENHGCVIAQHGGMTWNQYDELTLNRFFDKEKEFWDSLGVIAYGAVCPQHIISNMIRAVAGGRFGCLRTGYNNGLHYEYYTNGARSNLYGLSSQSSLDGSLQDQCNILDYCKANNKLRIIHWHENEMSAADKTQLEGIIDYAKSISLTFVTMKDIPYII